MLDSADIGCSQDGDNTERRSDRTNMGRPITSDAPRDGGCLGHRSGEVPHPVPLRARPGARGPVLCPMARGGVGARLLNSDLQETLNGEATPKVACSQIHETVAWMVRLCARIVRHCSAGGGLWQRGRLRRCRGCWMSWTTIGRRRSRREAVVRLLAMNGKRSRAAVGAAARDLGLSAAQLYRLIQAYRDNPVTRLRGVLIGGRGTLLMRADNVAPRHEWCS